MRWPPETFVANKVAGLAGTGMRVTVASREAGAGGGPAGTTLLALPAVGDRSLGAVLRTLWTLGRLAVRDPRGLVRLVRAIRGRGGPRRRMPETLAITAPVVLARPDIVHFEWESAAVRFAALFDACDCPVVMSVRGSGVSVNPFTGHDRHASSYPYVFDRAAAVHCVSEATRAAAEELGLDRAKAHVIHPAVDTRFFAPGPPRETEADRLRIVSVSQLSWLKGHEDALEATARLTRDGIRATMEVVGGDPGAGAGVASDRARLRFLTSELGLDDRVVWSGALAPEEVRERLRAADVLLHASLSEGLPNTVLEAMACGLPVVVTDCGGVAEAVEHGAQGLLCPTLSPDALADALRALHGDRELGRRMGRAGRERVEAEFALPDQIAAWRRLYDDVLGFSRSPRR